MVFSTDGRAFLAALLLATAWIAVASTPTARASVGYNPATPDPVLVEGIEFPHGVAVDQDSHHVYVAVVTKNWLNAAAGEIRRFESDGDSAGTFVAGPQAFFSGIAVNPVTQGFYGSQVHVKTPLGDLGTAQMDPFSQAGVLGTPFPLDFTNTLPQIATDSEGDVYFPNAATDSVQVFDSAGVLQEEIGCGSCPGGAFGMPASVAVDSDDDLYVVDLAPDRVVKFTVSGGSYEFDSILQSGRGAVAVGVDPSTDDVFVGDFPGGTRYHVVAYTSSGTQFDDFGAGMFIDPPLGAVAAAQIAADATTHKLYLTETDKIYVFERGPISPPSVDSDPASPVGQVAATLRATVNVDGHAASDCDFEYTDDADFQANGFANASVAPCSTLPDGYDDTAVEAKVTGLQSSTTYRFQVTASSNAGSATSATEALETLPVAPPSVTTESPLAVTQTSARLMGRVNPHGGSISDCHFEYGTSTSYGASVPCPELPGMVTTDVAQDRKVLGLTPGAGYHYRLVVSSNTGTHAGDDVEFTTVGTSSGSGSEPAPGGSPAPVTPPPAPPIVSSQPRKCGPMFRMRRVRGKARCVRVCRNGFRKTRRLGGVKCVKRKRQRIRADPSPRARAGRR